MNSRVKYFIRPDGTAVQIYRPVIYQGRLQMRHFSGSYRYLNRPRFWDRRPNSLPEGMALAQFQGGLWSTLDREEP